MKKLYFNGISLIAIWEPTIANLPPSCAVQLPPISCSLWLGKQNKGNLEIANARTRCAPPGNICMISVNAYSQYSTWLDPIPYIEPMTSLLIIKCIKLSTVIG